MIVGTSTGGIIAAIAGFMAFPLSQCQDLYDNLIHKIFVKHPTGGMKLALTQASGQKVVVHYVLFEIVKGNIQATLCFHVIPGGHLGAFCCSVVWVRFMTENSSVMV